MVDMCACRRWWCTFVTVVCSTLMCPGLTVALAPTATHQEHIEVKVEAGLLTLEARDAELVDVVKAIGEVTGFETVVAGDTTRQVTSSFSRVSVPEALAKLLYGIDHVVLYAPAGEEGATGAMSQVWLLGMSEDPGHESVGAADGGSGDALPPDAGVEARTRSENLLRLTREGATEEVLDTLSDALQNDAEPLVRVRAAMALGKLGDRRALPALEYALTDEHESVQLQAIQALSQIGDETATLLLGDILLQGEGAKKRVLAAWGLWRHDTEIARAFLADAANDPDEQVRRAAIRPPEVIRDSMRDPSSVTGDLEFESTQ